MQGQRDPNQSEPMDITAALKEVAAQKTVWAKVSLCPPLTAYALNALKRQKHTQHRVNIGTKWLLDSAEEVQLLIEGMQTYPPMRLPVLRGGAFAGQPRIYAIMAVCAIFYEGKINESVMKRALSDFQAYRELNICEVEQAQRCMKWVLLDLVGKSALALIDRMQTYEGAHREAKRIDREQGADQRVRFATMAGRIAYAAQLQRSLVYAAQDRFVHYSIVSSQALRMSPMDTNRAERREALLKQREIKNILFSLDTMRSMDDPSLFLTTHPAINMLEGQNEYAALDDASKAHIRSFTRRIAHRASILESDVVRIALRLCGDEGKMQLLSTLWEDNKPLCTALGIRFYNRRRWAGRFAVFLQWVTPAALSAVYVYSGIVQKAVLLEVLGGFLFGFVVLHACACQLFERLLPCFVKPVQLPRFESVPQDTKTVVVIPAMVETREQIDKHFWRLQVQSQAFGQAVQFILCCDFPKSGLKEDKLGADLTVYGTRCARKLNGTNDNRFAFVTRARTYVRKQGAWMGLDRERGALMALNSALLGRRDSVSVHGAQLAFGVRYVLVLGGDAFMPSGEAQRLMCTMAHPQNAQYALMQPRLVTSAESLSQTPLARLYAKPGMTIAQETRHDCAMDLHGFGVYQGVGLYDIRRFVRAVRHLPQQRLLSYHFVEGALANSVLVTDVQAVCTFADRYSAYSKQMHRRIRGTWQMLPLVLKRMRDDEGNRIVLMLHQRLWVMNRILMTLVTLSTTQLLAIATFSVLPFWTYFIMALLPYACPLSVCLINTISVVWKREQVAEYTHRVCCHAYRWAADVALCPYDASISVDATVRALYRMAISKKKLMEWLTKQQARGGDAYTFAGYAWHMLPALLFNMLMVLFVFVNKPNLIWPILTVAAIWCISPLVAQSLDRHPKPKPAVHAAYWTRLCKQTYDYFRAITTSSARYLPPHSIRMDVENVMKYTTPTDIGMALLASACAQALGFVSAKEATGQMARLMDTVNALPKWKGHLNKRIVLLPSPCGTHNAVNSLDSAMLVLALMVCEQALGDWGEWGLSKRARMLWRATDFNALFCLRRRLFAEGCDGSNGDLTKICHELYASQARILSFVALGCNQAKASHLTNLRRLYRKGGLFHKPLSEHGALEAYLLPVLFLLAHPYTYEGRLMRCAVSQQRKLARRRRRPLAIAKTSGTGVDKNGHIKEYGMRSMARNPKAQVEDVAVAYAAALTAPFDECEAYDTLCEMERYGLRGDLGFFDALYFDANGVGKPAREYVTAHQGYVLMAATNVVTNGQLTRWAARATPVAAVLPWYECCR